MRVQTTYTIKSSPEELWPLLFNSKMDKKQPCYFLCGLPKPLECRLSNEAGGIGSGRECVSDKGIIHQTITEWNPGKTLAFNLVNTDIYFGPCVESIKERFEISTPGGAFSSITRTTVFTLKPHAQLFASIPMFIGLKAIHRYVFTNRRRILAEKKYPIK